MNTTKIIFLLALLSCGKDDGDEAVDPEVGDPCDATFTLTGADGTTVEMDECKHHGVDMGFATMPDTTLPQPHNISFIFRSTKDTNVDCWVRLDINRSCPGRTQYNLGDDDNALEWNTTGCDVPESAQGSFVATYGSTEFTAMTSAPTEGLAEGSPMSVYFSADVTATAEDGTELNGTVIIDEDVPLAYVDFVGCSGSDGDADEDGSVGTQYGGDDCNDDDPQIGPHAVEVCDEVDNNCDGAIDEGVTQTFYEDADGDGHGTDDSAFEACEQPDGASQFAGDCNDESASISPSAFEVCDGFDNDCDDVADEGTQIAIFQDTDGDGYGADDSVDVSCPDAVPEGWTTVGLDCDDDDDSVNPDAEEVCDGFDNDCNGAVDELPSCD
jgi:hypothetical protein